MSQERVLEILKGFGFSEAEAKVYVFLSKKGPQKGIEISRALKMNKPQLYSSLKTLESKGVISITLEHPAHFAAAPFEKVLDSLVKAKMEEAQLIAQRKAQILSDWQSIVVGTADDVSAKFMVFEGKSRIYSRIRQMFLESKHSILAISTVTALAQADELGLFEVCYDHLLESKIQLRFLMEIGAQNAKTIKNLSEEFSRHRVTFQGKDPSLGLKSFPRLIVKDDNEILLFLKPTTDISKVEEDDTCLWTNCRTLISGFITIFEEMWRNSLDIDRKIIDVTRSSFSRSTYCLADPKKAKEEYYQKVKLAKKEVLILTSSQGLLDLWTENCLFRRLSEKGVVLKILAPIIRENMSVAEQFLKFSTVKHVPSNYVGITIVDGKYLFQYKSKSMDREKPSSVPHFFTNDTEYIERMKNTLNEMWSSACVPSNPAFELEKGPMGYSIFPLAERDQERLPSLQSFTVVEAKPPGMITEKDVLDKITKARKYPIKNPAKDINVVYASQGSAIVRLPDHFNMPDMLIHVDHIEKQSSFGEGDAIEVHLRLNTPRGPRFVAVGGLGDNPRGVLQRKSIYAGTPFEHNYQLVGKDKLQMRVFGNTLFAGWTVPIQLDLPARVLPPGCIIFEGNGKVKTSSDLTITASGMKIERELNWFDAFVTFMHPESKYSGPGTDGVFIRDLITIMTPKEHD